MRKEGERERDTSSATLLSRPRPQPFFLLLLPLLSLSPFGSHTAEVILTTIARLADGSAPVLRDADEETLAKATTAATATLELSLIHI